MTYLIDQAHRMARRSDGHKHEKKKEEAARGGPGGRSSLVPRERLHLRLPFQTGRLDTERR